VGPVKILGPSLVTLEQARAWATAKGAHQRFVSVAWHYWDKCPRYGIPAELAFAQAAHETNWGKYTGIVPSTFHNWCGLKTKQGGSNTSATAHQKFDDDATGVLAHIQHLARYAGAQTLPAGDALVDPRWLKVTQFTDTVEGLGGPLSWAPRVGYGADIAELTNDLRAFAQSGGGGVPMTAQIPGFIWYPADADHYDVGRTEKIRGGAQHYTAGTNSLDWLTKTSGDTPNSEPVSATFLVKHNPTMEDRGWQLVKIEDTAWTTAFANPYTVSIEYEHRANQPIPDIAYEVLAQTWADITNYVKQHNLGKLERLAGHKIWVNNPQLICPDGIDMSRIIPRWLELLYPEPPTSQYFDETGFTVGGGFLQFWKSQGGLTIFGYPITDEFIEQGHTVQYFERARFEHHPNTNPALWDVLLGRVGAELIGYDGP
jgi:hypothetical protein